MNGCSNLRFFMQLLHDDPYIGKIELAECYAVAFLASCSTPEKDWTKVERWLEAEIYRTNKVVMSGFHSPFERRVLQCLFEHNHPAILYLARSLYKRMPHEYEEPLANGQLLILSYFEQHKRNSYRYADARNAYLMKIADEVATIGVTPSSKISTMLDLYRQNCDKPYKEL